MASITSTHTVPYRLAPARGRGRAGTIALWALQIAIAGMFFLAGGLKLAGAPLMVEMFTKIGFGPWFRYLTGSIEVTAATALLVPALAPYGALLIVPTMVGAVVTHLFIVGGSPLVPALLLIGALVVLTARRQQLADAWSRLR